jgi:NADPH:quinone reductase
MRRRTQSWARGASKPCLLPYTLSRDTTRILKTNGVLASYSSNTNREPHVPYYAFASKNATLHCVLVYAMSAAAHQAAIDDITTCLTAGVLRHPTPHRFALTDIVAAHEALESGRITGKVMLDLV